MKKKKKNFADSIANWTNYASVLRLLALLKTEVTELSSKGISM